MAQLIAPALWQETRLCPTYRSPSRVLDINTSLDHQQQSAFGAGRKRGFNEISGTDEEAFAHKYLATEGSLFFRGRDRAPRNFLWRVVESRRRLEVQSVDLVQDTSIPGEGWLTFRFAFPSAIISNGVALADGQHHDSLDIFVLTTSNDLYTFTLKRDLLTRETAPTEFDARTCMRKYTCNTFSFRHPYRFVAVDSQELLISLSDGGLLRMQRQGQDSVSQWRETFFSDGGWSGTLRGLIPLRRHQTVKYGSVELEPNAIAALATSPDGKYIWTLSLDNVLRAWDKQNGKRVAQHDLLSDGNEREGRPNQRFVMDAEQGTLLQVVKLPPSTGERRVASLNAKEEYFLVVYVPKFQQFRFYGIERSSTPTEGEAWDLERLHSEPGLTPPLDELMNTNIWHLAEFYVQPGANWRNSRIWVRTRNGAQCQIFTLIFEFYDEEGKLLDLDVPWRSAWSVVDPGMQSIDSIRASLDLPGQLEDFATTATTPSEQWLDFIFRPGRFSTASIETSLYIYRKGRGLLTAGTSKGLNATKVPLKERLFQAITSQVTLRRFPNQELDNDRYQSDSQAQWRTFFSILAHIHSRRNETIGFTVDLATGLPWTVGADFVAPVRKNDSLETITLNAQAVSDERLQSLDNDVAVDLFPGTESMYQSAFVSMARDFAGRLSPDFRLRFSETAISQSLTQEVSDGTTNGKKAQNLYEQCNMGEEVMDDDFQALQAAADETLHGLGSISADFLIGILELFCTKPERRTKVNKSLSPFGDKFTVAVAQETLEMERQTLLSVAMLVVFMHGDLEREELDGDFLDRIDEVYDGIAFRLKINALLLWLASHDIPEASTARANLPLDGPPLAQNETLTLLERIAIGDWTPKSDAGESLAEQLTTWAKQWLFGGDFFGSWDSITGYIFGFLLKERLYQMATEFQRFIMSDETSSDWIKYLQGRLMLATGEYASAQAKFQSAAARMGEVRRITTADDAHLLSDEERNQFGQGPTAYYQHVATLYERLSVWSYAADFARMALDFLDHGIDADQIYAQDRLQNDPDSSQMEIIDAVMVQQRLLNKGGSVREELLSRLFNTLLQTGRYQEAFTALQQLNDLPVKRSELKKLLDTCVKTGAIQDLLALPYEAANLVHETDAVLLSLAEKELVTSTSTSRPFCRIVHAFRLGRSDYRGAAQVLHEQLERLKHTREQHSLQDPEDETLLDLYVLLITTLACCGEDKAWLLADPIEGVHEEGAKRRLVKLADVRRDYVAELDRRSDILQGRFALTGRGDEMDVL